MEVSEAEAEVPNVAGASEESEVLEESDVSEGSGRSDVSDESDVLEESDEFGYFQLFRVS